MSNIIFFSLVAFTLYIVTLVLISLKMTNRTKDAAYYDRIIEIPAEDRKLELELTISADAGTGNAFAETIIKNPAPNTIYSYAFYLVVDGERKSARWHEASPKFEFLLPDSGGRKEIVAFVRDDQNHSSSIKKTL